MLVVAGEAYRMSGVMAGLARQNTNKKGRKMQRTDRFLPLA
jgi:hypothetical protein